MFPPVRRVTLVGAQRRVDLILPATIPVGDLLPELIQLGGIDGATDPARWVLTRAAGPDLAADLTLEDCDVGDGEILLLRHQEAPPLGALTAEAVDVVAEVSDEGKGRWSAAATLRLLAGATLASQTAIAIFLLEQREESATPLIAGVLTVACMVLALLLTNRDVLAGQLAAAGGIVVLGSGGAALVAAGDGWPPLVMAAAGAAGVG
ncbi:MAG: EsaB/YukD family protein, partial [Actinomycetota bacterium]